MTKQFNLAAVVLFIALFCTVMGKTADAAVSTDVNLVINNEQVSADVMPFIEQGRTLVPARAVFEALGGTVKWDPDTYTVTIEHEASTVILKINDTVAAVDGDNKILDVPAAIKNGRTVIPVRFVAEELGYLVEWVDTTRTVTITSQKEPEESPGITGEENPEITDEESSKITDEESSEVTGEEIPEITGLVTEVSVEEGTSRMENTIVTVQLSEPLKTPEEYPTMILTSPDRFVVDIKDSRVDTEVTGITYDQKNSPLTAIRIADYNENMVRVVCDLKEATKPSVNLSEDGKTITIIFRRLSTYFDPMEDGKLVVVLDPGHGESTAGKRSPDGSIREYAFNRDVAQKMKDLLEDEGIEVLLTVEDNSDPSLASRCETANNSDADIFVSIHGNAFGNGRDWTSPSGWEIYHYHGCVLSNQLAKSISKANFPRIGILNRGIKTANFYVIKNTYMPAVLIEHGFYTNKEEGELMKSDEWQEQAAQYDVEGIMNFLKSFPETE